MARDVRVNVTLKELGPALRGLYPAIRKSVQRATVECALRIAAQVQVEIDETDTPSPPVNTGAYAAAWRWRRTKDGAIVFNSTPQAEWIERGRNAGPISKEGREALKLWVKRKGIHIPLAIALQTAAHRKQVAAYLGATAAGVRVRGPTVKDPNRPIKPPKIGATTVIKPRKRAPADKNFLEQAAEQITYAIAESITRYGYHARFPLWRAIRTLEKELETIFLAAILEGIQKTQGGKKK